MSLHLPLLQCWLLWGTTLTMRNRQLFWGSPINVKSRCKNGLEKMGIGLCLCNKKRNYFFSKFLGKEIFYKLWGF